MNDVASAGSARPDEQSGFSLIELMVVLAVMGVILTAFVGLLGSVQRGMVRETNRSSTMDQARLAIEAIDREVRSASVMCLSATGTPAVYTLSVYSRSAYDATTTTMHWIRYRLQTQYQRLQRQQSMSTGPILSAATWPSTWHTLATGIVNSTNPFSLDASAQYVSTSGLSRLLNLNLIVNSNTGDDASSDVTLNSAIAIRNLDTSLSCS
jgi:prepilin-type N-terminal cleavage/methylation domain-containing protein